MVNADALALLKKINKSQGEGTAVLASDLKLAGRFPSGSLTLDVALGGGWPANHWVEVYGRESHGKTTVVLKTIAANQEADPAFTTLWVAAEHFDAENAVALGVDLDRVIVVPTQRMEFAYQTMLEFAESRSVDCIVLDSYPALIADEEASKDMDAATLALGARLTGKFFRKAGAATRRSSTDLDDRPMLGIIVNQQRDAIGSFSPYGVPQTTPGGNGKNYAFFVRVEVKRGDFIKEKLPGGKGEIKVGQQIKCTTIKNKSAPPQQVAIVDFYFRDAATLGFGRGEYDLVKELSTLAIVYDVVERRGAYYLFGEQKWQGKDAFIASLYEDLTLREQIRSEIMGQAGKPRQDREEPGEDDE